MRRFLAFIAFLLAAGAVWYWWPGRPHSAPRPAGKSLTETVAKFPARPATPSPAEAGDTPSRPRSSSVANGAAGSASFNETDFPLAAQLNAPNSTIARDLDVMRQIFETWQTNFPHEGNPIGENADITAVLMGDNRLGLVLIPKGHRAVNENGELCDRWGTPFRFHQLSGTRMEIRSAGPDRKFTTEDDAVWTPP